MGLEPIQPVAGESIQKEFLKTKGEGIHYLGFIMDDLDKETTKLVKKGFKVINSTRTAQGHRSAYFDTDKVGSVVFELSQFPPE